VSGSWQRQPMFRHVTTPAQAPCALLRMYDADRCCPCQRHGGACGERRRRARV